MILRNVLRNVKAAAFLTVWQLFFKNIFQKLSMIAPNKLLEQLQSLQASYLLWRLYGIDLKYNYAVMNPAVYICHEHTDGLSVTG